MLSRTHISIFGPRNAGKSTLTNLITQQQTSIVSEVAGTTTDPVSKPIEINGIGPCVIIDTPGYDDNGELGSMRVTRTKQITAKTDIAIFLIPSTIINDAEQLKTASQWYALIKERTTSIIPIINLINSKGDDVDTSKIKAALKTDTITLLDLSNPESRTEILRLIGHTKERSQNTQTIIAHLVKPQDTVMLVMPQDTQAPAGRLILPQVQTIRELLDCGCNIICTTPDNMQSALDNLQAPPALIVTDSQAFAQVYQLRPANTPLTSFSVLLAQAKGDINQYVTGVKTLASLNAQSRILIAEACSHAPLAEDIGREKIPHMIRTRISPDIKIDIVSGLDWTDIDIAKYSLIIQCGACVASKAQVLNLINTAKSHNVPITNYGITIAYLNNILDKIIW